MAKQNIELSDITPIQLVSKRKEGKESVITKGKKHAEKILALSAKGKGNWEIKEKEKFNLKDGVINHTGSGTVQQT